MERYTVITENSKEVKGFTNYIVYDTELKREVKKFVGIGSAELQAELDANSLAYELNNAE